jgi:hypothetical protein
MAKKKNTSTLVGQKLRIRILHEIILNEPNRIVPEKGGDRAYLVEEINKKLALRGLQGISIKTLELDIKAINNGDFDEGNIYALKFNHANRRYGYNGKNIPYIPFLEQEEEQTLAFLKGVLEQHSDLPAVQKLIKESATLFNTEIDKVSTQKAFLVKKPEFGTDLQRRKLINTTLILLEYIKEKNVVQFSYVESQKLEYFQGIVPNQSVFRAYPLCVRMYEGLYYLTALSQVNPDHEIPNNYLIRNFRIDHINDKSINKVIDPLNPEEFERFKPAEIWVDYNLETLMAKSIGVWNFDDSAVEEEVIIRFYGWAANHLMVFKIHSSQTLLDMNVEENYIDVHFKFYTYPRFLKLTKRQSEFHKQGLADGKWTTNQFPYVEIFERYPEVGNLLGKYVNFMQVLI